MAALATVHTVLLVEDDPITVMVAEGLLEDAGIGVTVANDGETAVQLATERAYDLILMDFSMPGMDGITATRTIRDSTSINASTPIIGLTAEENSTQREAALAAGMQHVHLKPIDFELFHAAGLALP
uniref:Putative Response regulator protein n=1 Tax=Magnetococcus massalia (strain MO-1) TaxID=451514 RepID=A0A1S7LHP0_MAGMO|nr:putative Response regulator protein [Candidatus Magnetococcus massalia]